MKQTLTGWWSAAAVYRHPRVAAMLFLGFSAGLPFLLVFSTLSAWLRDQGVERSTIGFFGWVGIMFSIKVLWAPIVDRLPLPLLTRALGKRRSWMLVAQIGIAIGLSGMALTDPGTNLAQLAMFALLVAFGSATQDITIDAYRIEAVDRNLQGAMAASYVLGYRLALLTAGAGALHLANLTSWTLTYLAMAGLMGIGMLTTLVIREPQHRPDRLASQIETRLVQSVGVGERRSALARLVAWFSEAVVSPFVEFFERNGRMALMILLLVGCYKLSDITMGVMANPFYLDLGFGHAGDNRAADGRSLGKVWPVDGNDAAVPLVFDVRGLDVILKLLQNPQGLVQVLMTDGKAEIDQAGGIGK